MKNIPAIICSPYFFLRRQGVKPRFRLAKTLKPQFQEVKKILKLRPLGYVHRMSCQVKCWCWGQRSGVLLSPPVAESWQFLLSFHNCLVWKSRKEPLGCLQPSKDILATFSPCVLLPAFNTYFFIAVDFSSLPCLTLISLKCNWRRESQGIIVSVDGPYRRQSLVTVMTCSLPSAGFFFCCGDHGCLFLKISGAWETGLEREKGRREICKYSSHNRILFQLIV